MSQEAPINKVYSDEELAKLMEQQNKLMKPIEPKRLIITVKPDVGKKIRYNVPIKKVRMNADGYLKIDGKKAKRIARNKAVGYNVWVKEAYD